MRLTFLGAAGCVTGSKYLVDCGGRRLLVDCGLYQGYKQLRLRNWAPEPVDPATVDAVILTHAHIDHSGYLPRFVRDGFRGPVFCTEGTDQLCRVLLPDSAYLQEEDARFANRHGFSKHHPALPLYTRADAARCLGQFRSLGFDTSFEPLPGVSAVLRPAGHILGAASVRIESGGVSLNFSGDLGRPDDSIMRPPAAPLDADYLVIESTYGDRLHPATTPDAELAPALQRAIDRNGIVVIPTFAVGRAQALMLEIARLKKRNQLPDVPVYLDSPMAIDATQLYQRFASQHRLDAEESSSMSGAATWTSTPDQSKALAARKGPMIILAASGMATGGRVVHHLKNFAGDARNMIVLAGYQVPGTRGAALATGAHQIRIHGQLVDVRAEVVSLESFSAHADANELLAWMRSCPSAPRLTFITHGEPGASDALRSRIEHDLHWAVSVPAWRDEVDLE